MTPTQTETSLKSLKENACIVFIQETDGENEEDKIHVSAFNFIQRFT